MPRRFLCCFYRSIIKNRGLFSSLVLAIFFLNIAIINMGFVSGCRDTEGFPVTETHLKEVTDMIESLEGMKETIRFGNSSFRLIENDVAEDYPSHWHAGMEIIMPVRNSYEVTVGKDTFLLCPDDILLINAGEIHSIKAPEEGMRYIFQISLSSFYMLDELGSALLLLPGSVYLCPDKDSRLYEQVRQRLLDIFEEAGENRILKEASILSWLIQIIALLIRSDFQETPRFPSISSASRREYMEKFTSVCRYINTSYGENISLESAAQRIGFSKFHFARLFKEFTGVTFHEYLNRRRIQRVEELLADNAMPVTDAALQAGFTSISNFNRTFKMYNHCSPSQFRKKQQEL